MGLQRVGHNFATEQQQHLVESLLINDLLIPYINVCQLKSKELQTSAPSESRLCHIITCSNYNWQHFSLSWRFIIVPLKIDGRGGDKLRDYHWHPRRQWQAIPVLLPRESHGRRSMVGCSPWGRYKSDTTERLHFHFSLSCTGEGNGNPLQCSCLENPRDGGAWWAVYGVAQSRTRLKLTQQQQQWKQVRRQGECENSFEHTEVV